HWTPAPLYGYLGQMAHHDGDYARAATLLEQCISRMRVIDDQTGLAIMLGLLGEVSYLQGDLTRATTCFQESIRFSRRIGRAHNIALGLVGLATVATARGQHERAAVLCAAAETLPESVREAMSQTERATYDRSVAAIRDGLHGKALEAAC